MRFPNAAQGISKLFLAEILALIGSVLLSFGLIFGLAAIGMSNDPSFAMNSIGALNTTIGFTAVFSVAGLVLLIVAYVLNLIGLYQAQKDEKQFLKYAFILSICLLAATVIMSIAGLSNTMPQVYNTITNIVTMIVFIMTVSGVSVLAGEMNREDMQKLGRNILIIFCIIVIASIVIGWIPFIGTVAGVLSAILSIAMYVLYIIYLAKAKKMLKETVAESVSQN